MTREVFIPHRLEDTWGVRDIRTDELLRNWRGKSRSRGRIWRGTKEDAESLAHLLNTGEKDAPREEMPMSQKVHWMNVSKRKPAQRAVTKSSFSKCAGCGKMVKSNHQCPKEPPA